jgi:isopropylmalate/homocitrate/citramalate synthase
LEEDAMSDLPQAIEIVEEGPREGFQIEQAPIRTADKIALIDALSATGLKHIQAASFVNPKLVPGWADAEAVVAGFAPREGVDYSALWFNEAGLRRALTFKDRLTLAGSISLSASEAFSRRNLNRDHDGQIAAMHALVEAHQKADVPVSRVVVMAAFGCNFSGDVAPRRVIETIEDGMQIATDKNVPPPALTLADTMGWATPQRVARLIGETRNRWPDLSIALHLHDTRGLGIANSYEALRLGVTNFDAAVGGLGGCPFAGQPGAPGNIATEELVLLCEEMGIATGVDLDALFAAGRLAEKIVGRKLPSAALRSGGLNAFRRTGA